MAVTRNRWRVFAIVAATRLNCATVLQLQQSTLPSSSLCFPRRAIDCVMLPIVDGDRSHLLQQSASQSAAQATGIPFHSEGKTL